MSEEELAYKTAEHLLDEPYADPDDNLRMLSRQLLRHKEEINRLKYRLNHQTDDDIQSCKLGLHKDCGK